MTLYNRARLDRSEVLELLADMADQEMRFTAIRVVDRYYPRRDSSETTFQDVVLEHWQDDSQTWGLYPYVPPGCPMDDYEHHCLAELPVSKRIIKARATEYRTIMRKTYNGSVYIRQHVGDTIQTWILLRYREATT